VFLGGGVVGTAFNDFLNMFWFHVDRHSTNDGVCGWLVSGLEPNWTRRGHSDK
jgi:hypothetical protein